MRTPVKHLSPHLKKMLEQLKKQKPNLTEKTQELLGAFYRLDRERERVGQMASPQHIKQSQIIDYIKNNGSHGFEGDYFEKIIFEIDEAHLKAFYEKQKQEAKKHG
jgi:flagellar motor component MotA